MGAILDKSLWLASACQIAPVQAAERERGVCGLLSEDFVLGFWRSSTLLLCFERKKGFYYMHFTNIEGCEKRGVQICPKNPKVLGVFSALRGLTEKTEVRSNGYSTCSLSISSPSCYTFDGGSALWQFRSCCDVDRRRGKFAFAKQQREDSCLVKKTSTVFFGFHLIEFYLRVQK